MFNLLHATDSHRTDKYAFDIINTRDSTNIKEYLDACDPLEAYRILKDVTQEITSVKLENTILLDFLQKNDPKMLIGLDQVRRHSIENRMSINVRKSPVGSLIVGSPTLSRSESRATSIAESTGGSNKLKSATDYRINYRTKAEIAHKLACEIQKNCEVLEAKGKYDIKILSGQIAELEYRCIDTEDTLKNFELHFIKNNVLENASNKQMETYLRKFINHWLKNGRALLGTMRLKIASLQELCQQQRSSLISKADLSGMLGPVDFHQLQIKRDVQTRTLEEKNVSLAGLKEVTGKAALALAKEKKAILTIEHKSRVIAEHTADIAKGISKLEQEAELVTNEVIAAEESLRTLKIQVESFEAPSVTEYIRIKQEIISLEKEEKLLLRKSYIQKIKSKNIAMKLRNIKESQKKSSNE